ncbi:MAG TPA: PRC-barrel domain-containing protein [Stellaceae bacterium]|nr:PRC-barrel domain-containing protein [Stellaceae bacterium]
MSANALRAGGLVLLGAIAAAGAGTLAVAQEQPASPAAPVAQPSAEKPKVNPQIPENVEPLPASEATGVLGKKVRGPNGEDLGLIVDVLVDAHGLPRAAVIDFGGFLGVGSRKVAIDWQALNFSPGGRTSTLELSLDRAQIQAAPEYKADSPTAQMVVAPPALSPPDGQK